VGACDLHVHSSASDGKFSPAEVVRKAGQAGIRYLALADHDSVDGIIPALQAVKAFPRMKLLPCVEVSTDVPHGEVHVLGYFIDYIDENLKATLKKFRESRLNRAEKMVKKLGTLGVHVRWERVKEIAGAGAVGRPHIAQAMLEKGYIKNMKEAFLKYIGRESPAYVEREKMTPVEAVGEVLKYGGLPVLAHPLSSQGAEMWVIELKAMGLAGIEVYCNNYSPEDMRVLFGLATKYDLLVTGGSDFHGLGTEIEAPLGSVPVPVECAERLFATAKQRGLRLT
jgi:predicted metal-dependent phosphoesterase TrpH